MLVIVILNDGGIMRFNEIQKAMDDISQRMLTVTLRSLEADGLISRRIYPEVPPRVEYSLTPLGKSLLPALTMLVDWAKENTGAIQEARRSFESVNK